MLKRLQILFRFFKFFLAAKTKYQVHSPFVYGLINAVLDDRRNYYSFEKLEWLRTQLLDSDQQIELNDLGAGSVSGAATHRRLSAIAGSALSGAWQCRILFKLVNWLQPDTMLEMGTSLGISTLYQNAARRRAKMITLEGSPAIARIAKAHFDRLRTQQIELRVGAFLTTLPDALKDLQRLDYAFIDGDHRRERTLQYFEQCLTYSHPETLLIFDDIHWSADMEAAWEEIKRHKKVRLTVDLFFMGLVFLRKEQKQKQHFKIVPTRWKFWQTGFFRS